MDLPGREWPTNDLAPITIDKLIRAYATKGFTECESGEFEVGIEKIAIYARDPHGEPTHAAVQLETGLWASKMGRSEDIHHLTLDNLTDDEYGHVVKYLQRERPLAQEAGRSDASSPVGAPSFAT
jgi:hypothetical protein